MLRIKSTIYLTGQANTNPSSVAGYCGGRVTKIQNRRNGRVKSIKLSECFGYAQRRRLRRVLGFRIWILFGVWDLRFGILASFLDKQIIVI